MDTEVWAAGPQTYEIRASGGSDVVGRIHIDADPGQRATIEPVEGGALAGVETGPYTSRSAAMEIVGTYLRGNCDMGGQIQH